MSTVITARRGAVLTIELHRPEKANAFDPDLLAALADAYTELDRDPALRVGVVHAAGAHFTGGLDLPAIAPYLLEGRGEELLPADRCDPWGMWGPQVSKPIVVAVHGRCYTAGLELVLAADCTIAADDAVFGQQEVSRGIIAFGGAIRRLPQRAGWGDGLSILLTGDTFDAHQAHRLGIVQQVVPAGQQLEAALAVADRIAAQAPLAVQATLRQARLAALPGTATDTLADALRAEIVALAGTEDAAEAISAMVERRPPTFVGR